MGLSRFAGVFARSVELILAEFGLFFAKSSASVSPTKIRYFAEFLMADFIFLSIFREVKSVAIFRLLSRRIFAICSATEFSFSDIGKTKISVVDFRLGIKLCARRNSANMVSPGAAPTTGKSATPKRPTRPS